MAIVEFSPLGFHFELSERELPQVLRTRQHGTSRLGPYGRVL